MTFLSRIFLSVVKPYSIYILQFGSVNDFIDPIRLGCLTVPNYIRLRKSVRDIVDLKCCS